MYEVVGESVLLEGEIEDFDMPTPFLLKMMGNKPSLQSRNPYSRRILKKYYS